MLNDTNTNGERKMAKAKRSSSANTHGSKWIRPEKRLRIYTRDEWTCACCGRPVYSAALLEQQKAAPAADAQPATLDHFKPRSKGGSNHETNLVTLCLSCNSARGNKPFTTFARELEAAEIIRDAAAVVATAKRNRKRVLPAINV